nr:hypothetical protein [Tanacetum cinerariifolium]GEW63115.1 hypothetical protein [Tanacetum cinerariifolium]
MGRDTVQLETAVNTISQEYLLEFTSEYGVPEALHPELPKPEDRIVDFPESKRKSAPKDGMPAENTYSAEAVRILDTHRTPIQKQSEALLCLLGLSRRYYLRDEVYPTFLHDDDRGGYGPVQLNPRSQSHKEMEDPAAATDSSGVPSIIERSPLDFANKAGAADQGTMAPEVPPPEDVPTIRGAPEAGQAKGVAATDPSAVTKSRKRGHDGVDANAPPNVLRRDHADPRPTGSTRGGKSLAAIELGMASTRLVLLLTLGHVIQQMLPTGDPESENASFASVVGSPESIYRPEWGIANGSMLDTLEACQDLMDHVTPPGYFLELRHLHNDDFLRQYNVNLARQVSNDHLSQQVATLQEQVSGEEKLKAAFEEFKQFEDNRVEQRCAEMDTRLDALSIDFDEELYAHMLTTIACSRWMIGHGLRLAVVKCSESLELRQAFADVVSTGIAKGMSEGLRHGVEHGRAQLDLEALEAYDPEAKAKYTTALQVLKNLKYPLVDQLEGLKDAPMDVIMASLHLESDTGDDALQWVRDLRPNAIAANVSCAEKKKKCRIVYRTHGVGSAHHARSDGAPVSVPTVVPQSLAILLADAATQTEPDEATLDNL